jgi:AcrR family transcriptional regulator
VVVTEPDANELVEPAAAAEPADADQPAWRKRAVSRSLHAARSRAEQRVQRFLDAAFELIDEKGTTDFTIQEVIDRSGQSLRGFYQYFDGKDELLLALFEETINESVDDLRAVVDNEDDPLVRLRAFVIRLHEWCDPGSSKTHGSHNRRPISEFSVQLAGNHPERVRNAYSPISKMLSELIEEARAAGEIDVADPRRTGALVLRTIMYSWFGNRISQSARLRVTADDTWDFVLHGMKATA